MRDLKNCCIYFNNSFSGFSKKITIIITFSLLIASLQTVWSQNNIVKDSLTIKSYKYLYDKVSEFYNTPIQGNIYANAYLKKAKDIKDSTRIVEGYFYLSEINKNNNSIALKYINNAIRYNRDNGGNLYTPYIYNHKGGLLHIKGKYEEALNNYLKAKELLIPHNFNKNLFLTIEYNIGILRFRVKDFKNALTSSKKSYQLIIKNNLQDEFPEDYLNILSALSFSFLYTNKIDSASHFNKINILEAKKYFKKHKEEYYYNTSRITEAYINYEKKEYEQSFDSINKYILYAEEIKDSVNLAVSYLYFGKSAAKLDKWELAIEQFKKVDTIVENTQKYIWEIEENYEILKNYYKNKGDTKNHLLYLEKLLEFNDSIRTGSSSIKNTILTKYDIPKLIAEKETLISKLQKKGSKKSQIIYLLIISSLCIILGILYFYKKRESILKKRFEILLQEKKANAPSLSKLKKELKIPVGIVSEILSKIRMFEEQKDFLDGSITLDSLAKKIGTNSNYLSKIINFHMGKNFSAYLSNLRINYIVEALKEESNLRKYTIKAIAFEVGFNNVKSFTDAFYKQTKIHPSYYIRELQKKLNSVDS